MTDPTPPAPYSYGERQIADMSARALRPGFGRISGALSVTLGGLSLLAVLCFRYPSWLTTRELREVYDVSVLRAVLHVAMWCSLSLGLLAFVRNRRKRLAAVGVLCTLAAFGLGGWRVQVGSLHQTPLAFGLDWLVLDLLVSALLFVFVEKVFPRYPEQVILRPEWKLDATYFALNHLLIGFLLLVSNHFATLAFGWAVNGRLQAAMESLPMLVQLVVLIVCADLFQYWVHRAYHEVPALWKLHAVHHSTEHMDWLAGSRSHIVETLIDRSMAMIPLYLLGPRKEALDLYVAFAAIQAVFAHANVGLRFGPLRYLLVTPQFHHWHHSSDRPAIDTNYAVHLPLLDRLFGTYHMPELHWPIQYGTVSPVPRRLGGQLLYPFRREPDPAAGLGKSLSVG